MAKPLPSPIDFADRHDGVGSREELIAAINDRDAEHRAARPLTITIKKDAAGRQCSEVEGMPETFAAALDGDEAMRLTKACVFRDLAWRIEQGIPLPPEVEALFQTAFA